MQRFKSLQEQNRSRNKELKAAKATIAELRAQAMFAGESDKGASDIPGDDITTYKNRVLELEAELKALQNMRSMLDQKSIDTEKKNRAFDRKVAGGSGRSQKAGSGSQGVWRNCLTNAENTS